MSSRTTALLGWATLLGLLATLWILFAEDPSKRQGARGGPLYEQGPDLIPRADKIILSDKDEHTTLLREGENWLIAEKNGYPASKSQVQDFLRNLILSERREPKTLDKANFPRLGLGPDALAVSLFDHDTPLTQIDIGTRSVGRTGRSLTYIYRNGDTRAWLVSAIPDLSSSPTDWIDSTVFSIDQSRLYRVDMANDIVLEKSSSKDTARLTDLKDDEEMIEDWQIRSDFTTLSDLAFTDVKKLDTPLQSPVKTLILSSFDGLVVTLSLYDLENTSGNNPTDTANTDSGRLAGQEAEQDPGEKVPDTHEADIWMQISFGYDLALAENGPPSGAGSQEEIKTLPQDPQAQAADFDKHARGWLFKPEDDLKEILLKTRSQYLVLPSSPSVSAEDDFNEEAL